MAAQNFVQYPQGNVLLRNLKAELPIIDYGRGVFLFDKSGKRYLDGVSGAFVASVGHGNKEVVEAISKQLGKVAYINGTQFTSEPTEKLASLLAEKAKPLGLDRSFFLCSGSEAVEAALKFCRQLWVERGEVKRHKLISRFPSYHGNTLYALSASGRPHYKVLYGPLLSEVVTISGPSQYRFEGGDFQNEGADFYAKELENTLQKVGADNVYALVVEPIVGSAGGAALPPPGYFKKLRSLCDQHGILIVADEVLVGAGRTGKFFASELVDLKPDVLVLGKGISGGYAPLSAVLVRKEHVDEIQKGSGKFLHAQTFLQAPCMTAAGVATLEFMDRNATVANSADRGHELFALLHKRFDSHPHVGNIAGAGLLVGIELVRDKNSKTPFDRKEQVTEKLTSLAFKAGLTLWPNVGHADGKSGDLLMFAPPLICQREHCELLVELLAKALSGLWPDL